MKYDTMPRVSWFYAFMGLWADADGQRCVHYGEMRFALDAYRYTTQQHSARYTIHARYTVTLIGHRADLENLHTKDRTG